MKKIIPSSESVEISIEDGGYGDPEIYLNIDGFHLVTLQGVGLQNIDEDLVVKYVRENAHTFDYKTRNYNVQKISGYNFLKQ